MQLRRLCRRCAFGLAVPFGFWLGAWPSSCAGAFVLPGAAAAAMPPVRFWVAAPLGLGLVLSLRLTLARLSGRMQLRRLCRRCAFGLAVPLGFGLNAWPRGCAADTLDLDVPFSPYKQSPPLRGGCRRQPAGGGMVYALIPPASLIPGRSGSYVSACAVRRDLRPAALQLFTTAPSVSEYFALYLQYDCTAARQRYAAKTAAAANSGWEVWAWPYLQKGGPVTVRPTE